MVAISGQHISFICKRVLIAPFSRCILTLRTEAPILTKKALSGRSQQRSKSFWPLSGLLWHSGYKSLLVMEHAVLLLICKPPLVYCMYFTAMGPSYLYRESKKCRYHQSYSWISFSLLGKLRLEKEWASAYSFQSLLNIRCCYHPPRIFFSWYLYEFPGLVYCYFFSSSHSYLWLLAVHISLSPLL